MMSRKSGGREKRRDTNDRTCVVGMGVYREEMGGSKKGRKRIGRVWSDALSEVCMCVGGMGEHMESVRLGWYVCVCVFGGIWVGGVKGVWIGWFGLGLKRVGGKLVSSIRRDSWVWKKKNMWENGEKVDVGWWFTGRRCWGDGTTTMAHNRWEVEI